MPRKVPNQPSPFAKAVATRDARAAIRIARTDPSVHDLQLPSHYGYELALKVAKIVLALGTDVNEVDQDGHTPLDYCTGIAHTSQFKTGQHHPRVAALLREHGAIHGADRGAKIGHPLE